MKTVVDMIRELDERDLKLFLDCVYATGWNTAVMDLIEASDSDPYEVDIKCNPYDAEWLRQTCEPEDKLMRTDEGEFKLPTFLARSILKSAGVSGDVIAKVESGEIAVYDAEITASDTRMAPSILVISDHEKEGAKG
jgi:hypothetical protein